VTEDEVRRIVREEISKERAAVLDALRAGTPVLAHLPLRLGTTTTDPMTIIKQGAGPAG
jgi:hypothetical protein